MQCIICGSPIEAHEGYALTTSGEYVHIACADRQASAAYRRRTILAIVSASLLVGLILVAFLMHLRTELLIMLIVGGSALHILIHRLWWNMFRQNVRRWWWLWSVMRHQRRRRRKD